MIQAQRKRRRQIGAISLDDTISHAGVLGMKWGVRRGRNASGKATSGTDEGKSSTFLKGGKQSADKTATEKVRKSVMKQIKSKSAKREKDWESIYLKRERISDDELKRALNRIQLENQLSQQVQTAKALSPTPVKTSFYDKMSGVALTASRVTPEIYKILPEKSKLNPTLSGINEAAKLVNQLGLGDKKKN